LEILDSKTRSGIIRKIKTNYKRKKEGVVLDEIVIDDSPKK
jgi:hypothetical protein